jgi:mono/diheme cytochrome c family protein
MRYLLILLAMSHLTVGAAYAASGDSDGDLAAGHVLAVRVCAECHDVQAHNGAAFSPTAAPTFYLVANAKTTTAIGLSVFLQTPHANMPNLILSEDERRNVIAYILQFREKE